MTFKRMNLLGIQTTEVLSVSLLLRITASTGDYY